jgi:hypothetical protein
LKKEQLRVTKALLTHETEKKIRKKERNYLFDFFFFLKKMKMKKELIINEFFINWGSYTPRVTVSDVQTSSGLNINGTYNSVPTCMHTTISSFDPKV